MEINLELKGFKVNLGKTKVLVSRKIDRVLSAQINDPVQYVKGMLVEILHSVLSASNECIKGTVESQEG